MSGLALLGGGTALAASIGGDHQSLPATLLLGSLALGLGHSLLEEIRRQARRASSGWSRSDTTNAVLLGVWAESALLASILLLNTSATRAVGLVLAVAYAAACGYFVTERRRAIAAEAPPAQTADPVTTAPTGDPTAKAPTAGRVTTAPAEHLPTTAELGVISPPLLTLLVPSPAGDLEDVADTVPHRHHPAGIGHAPTGAYGFTPPSTRPVRAVLTTPGRARPAGELDQAAHPDLVARAAEYTAAKQTHPVSPGHTSSLPATHDRPVAHAPAAHILATAIDTADATNAV